MTSAWVAAAVALPARPHLVRELGLAALVRSVVHLGGLLNMSGLSCRFRGVPDSSRPEIREGERSRLHHDDTRTSTSISTSIGTV